MDIDLEKDIPTQVLRFARKYKLGHRHHKPQMIEDFFKIEKLIRNDMIDEGIKKCGNNIKIKKKQSDHYNDGYNDACFECQNSLRSLKEEE